MTIPRPARRVIAEDVLAQRVNVDVYPFRYLYLSTPPATRSSPENGRAEFDARVDVVLTAVELLEARGWELVNLAELGQIAFMRRVTPPRRSPEYSRSDPGQGSREWGLGSRDVGQGSRDVGQGSRDVARGARDAWS
jgi:hypothetical protein